jgi:NagD protein
MMRIALKKLGCSTEETIIIGDRMGTHIIAGIESDIESCLVLSGITTRDMIPNYPYAPDYVLDGVGDLVK